MTIHEHTWVLKASCELGQDYAFCVGCPENLDGATVERMLNAFSPLLTAVEHAQELENGPFSESELCAAIEKAYGRKLFPPFPGAAS